MESLSQLEIFQNTVRHRRSPRFLFYARCTPSLDIEVRKEFRLGAEASLSEYFGMYNPVELSLDERPCFHAEVYMPYYAGMDIPEGATLNEIGVLQAPGSLYHFTRGISPLRNAETFDDIRKFPYVNVTELYRNGVGQIKEKVRYAHENGRVASCWIGHMYENAWGVRGYEPFLMDMVSNREWCEYNLDRFKDFNLAKAEAAAKAGADVIRTGDDVANQKSMMFSPKQWREVMKPRWAEVYQKARDIKPDIEIFYHSDGNIEEIIPDLIEIGVTILNPVQPECLDPVAVKRKYGDKLVIDGSIGTQSVMPFGSAEDVRRVVREMKEAIGYDGALILSPTHVLEPEVPVRNIVALIEEAGREVIP